MTEYSPSTPNTQPVAPNPDVLLKVGLNIQELRNYNIKLDTKDLKEGSQFIDIASAVPLRGNGNGKELIAVINPGDAAIEVHRTQDKTNPGQYLDALDLRYPHGVENHSVSGLVTFRDTDGIILGRRPSNAYSGRLGLQKDRSVSRDHLGIRSIGGGVYEIADWGSQNGTRLITGSKIPVDPNEQTALWLRGQ